MERENRFKPLTPEMKGKLIALYESNKPYSEIAAELGINVNSFSSSFHFFHFDCGKNLFIRLIEPLIWVSSSLLYFFDLNPIRNITSISYQWVEYIDKNDFFHEMNKDFNCNCPFIDLSFSFWNFVKIFMIRYFYLHFNKNIHLFQRWFLFLLFIMLFYTEYRRKIASSKLFFIKK